MILSPTVFSRFSSSWICSSCRASKNSRLQPARRALTTSSAPHRPSRKLPETPARTRFAPSPTGYLHLGSLRTALYNYLLAKATGGQFLLRIEDTDQSRTVPDALERICRDLEWAGLHWDEGPEVGGPYGPYVQSERIPIYRKHADKLLSSGHAYRCFCTSERLQELAQMRSKLGLPTDYDRTCAGIPKEESDDRASQGQQHVVRLKAPDAYPAFDDIIYGRVGKPRREARKLSHGQQIFEDPVLLKSDGRPTYHLANVVDDHLMKITHVVRAVEWTPSTPKHIYLYQALGWTPPAFAHVGLLQGANNQKLSKRSGDIDIGTYRRNGVFPDALVNFVALLGWHHMQSSDIMDLEQLVRKFNLSFTKGNTVVNFPKLDFMSREYAKRYAQDGGEKFEDMLDNAVAAFEEGGITRAPQGQNLRQYVQLILKADPTSYLDLANLVERHRSFFEWSAEGTTIPDKPFSDVKLLVEAATKLESLTEQEWYADSISKILQEALSERTPDLLVPEEHKRALSGLMSDLRRVILASRKGPGVALSLEILGRAETASRLKAARPFS